MDEEILIEFLEEAVDLVRSIDGHRRSWAGDLENPLYPQSLLENLHTLKGGALLCGLSEICDLVHRLEDLLAGYRLPGWRVDEAVLAALNSQRDRLYRLLALEREKAGLGRVANDRRRRVASEEPGQAASEESDQVASEGSDRAVIEGSGRAANEGLGRAPDAGSARAANEAWDHAANKGLRHAANEGPARAVNQGWGLTAKEGQGRIANEGLGREATLPLGRVLQRLDAGVQLLGRMLGKPVELRAGGIDPALDAGVMRRLVMALEEVLRDAVCHGIESPEHRRASGKPETGHIDLRFARRGDDLVVSIEDDGRGIDADRVRELAGLGRLLAEDVELRDADSVQFVFAPGLSTFPQVGPAAGRGMGLSAARTGIARLGGRVAVDYRPGTGARFVARIPWGIRIEGAWTFLSRNDRYAIPENIVEEAAPIAAEIRQEAAGSGIFKHAGCDWEFRFPGELLGYDHAGGEVSADGTTLLLRCGERRIALYAGAMPDRRDLVIGAAGSDAEVVPGTSLATLLDDGSLVVLLNPCALLDSGGNPTPDTSEASPQTE